MKPIDHYRPIFMGWVGFLVFSFTFLPFGQSASLGRPFLTIFSDQSQAKLVKDCQEDDIQSCQLVSVDFDALREAQTFLVPNSHSVLLERVTKIDGDDDSIDSYFYQARSIWEYGHLDSDRSSVEVSSTNCHHYSPP
ncbi:hypothetical protein TCAL_15815 [Tigriopus californicus]|uniref:Uncharacterized protein n=1 Tax=Tigriopus californicus TaxID=6832 RepID=A0A553NQN1_TIGCA|nr:hypothetical protein TCAL_15815 [Tigriopus californicus]